MLLRNIFLGLLIASYFSPFGLSFIPGIPGSSYQLISKNHERISDYMLKAQKSYDEKNIEGTIYYVGLYQASVNRNNAFLLSSIIEKINFTVLILSIYLIIKYEKK
ncbi:hypothetical protein [Nostoc sp.]|uniref:hypothetical protein n=1 Tax=Nostoc sp. TaxID=1180 RepID=UPI002FF84DF6